MIEISLYAKEENAFLSIASSGGLKITSFAVVFNLMSSIIQRKSKLVPSTITKSPIFTFSGFTSLSSLKAMPSPKEPDVT